MIHCNNCDSDFDVDRIRVSFWRVVACPFCADPDVTEVDDNPESEEPNAD